VSTEAIQGILMREDTGIPKVKSLTNFLRSEKVKQANVAEEGMNVLHSHLHVE